ncbi:hypothetical protein GOP47_0000173 [Adiantum capillus-veneris]|uniref:Guanine nucleotide-binding protein subunit beta-like protein n=1 Tax=Adiantum capillus-veneris TaxID=13818 RepID=A0A9D4VDF4_ADICA|nr:hypothetical protein GOP47_0000173 [Adiantum capillus-veneris]
MSLAELRERAFQASLQVKELKEQVLMRRAQLIDSDVASFAQQNDFSTTQLQPHDFVCCRTLQGHTGKVYALDWSQERDRIVSASQDGHLIVWNPLTSQKTHAIKLASSWVITCAFSSDGVAVASGGLDSICSVYVLNTQQEQPISDPKTLHGHKGYISCCKFVPKRDAQILTSSGDGTCALWEVESCQKVSVFGGDSSCGHSADVVSLSVNTKEPHIFVSGSCDRTAKLWDMRTASRATQTFQGHGGDVNTVQFLPDGLCFGTGSDDSTCKIFDTRTGHQLQQYKDSHLSSEGAKVNSIAFSISGRFLLAAYSNADSDCYIWDTLTAEKVGNLKDSPNPHTMPVSCIGLASDGSAVCTASWDRTLKVWASNERETQGVQHDGLRVTITLPLAYKPVYYKKFSLQAGTIKAIDKETTLHAIWTHLRGTSSNGQAFRQVASYRNRATGTAGNI